MVIIKATNDILEFLKNKLKSGQMSAAGLITSETAATVKTAISEMNISEDIHLEVFENGQPRNETIPGNAKKVSAEPMADAPVVQEIEVPVEKLATENPVAAEVTSEKKEAVTIEEASKKKETTSKPEEKKTESEPVSKESKEEIEFADCQPREVPPLILVPETKFSPEEAISKLKSAEAKLVENAKDSKWVLTELINKCKEDQDFVQYVMRPGKSFLGAYEYIKELAYNSFIGASVKFGSSAKMTDLSREDSIQYFVEYFMLDDDKIERERKQKAEKEKAEREAKAKESAAKKTRKKAAKSTGMLATPVTKAPVPEVKAEAKPAPEISKAPEPVKKDKKKEPMKTGEQLDLFSLLGAAM